MMTVVLQQFPIVQAPGVPSSRWSPPASTARFRLAAIAAKLNSAALTSAEDAPVHHGRPRSGADDVPVAPSRLRRQRAPGVRCDLPRRAMPPAPRLRVLQAGRERCHEATCRTKRKGRPSSSSRTRSRTRTATASRRRRGTGTLGPTCSGARAASKLARALYWQDAVNGVARNEVEDGEVPSAVPANVDPVTGEIHDMRPVGPVPRAASRDFHMEGR